MSPATLFPAAVPHILAGFRIAVPYAIGGAIIAERSRPIRGLGYLVQTGAMNFDTTSVFSAILAATLIVQRRQLAAQRRRAGAAALAAAAASRAGHLDLSMSDTPLLGTRRAGKRFPASQDREQRRVAHAQVQVSSTACGGGRQRSSARSAALSSQLAACTMRVAARIAENTDVVSKFIAPVCTR